MANWRDVVDARGEADRLADEASTLRGESGLMCAMLAVRAELRALGTLIDHARGDAR